MQDVVAQSFHFSLQDRWTCPAVMSPPVVDPAGRPPSLLAQLLCPLPSSYNRLLLRSITGGDGLHLDLDLQNSRKPRTRGLSYFLCIVFFHLVYLDLRSPLHICFRLG